MNSHIMQKIPLLIIICFSFPLFVFGQTSASSGIYYISGIVVDEQTKDSIPYVRIQVNHTKTGAMTNSEGFFRIPVGLLDTLHFTHIGYEKSSFIVRDYLEKYQGSLDQDILVVKYMRKTDYYLDEVTIFNGALSDQDIMDLYNAQSMAPVVPPGMVANYAFSNNATDGTSFNNHGVVTDDLVADLVDQFRHDRIDLSRHDR